MHPDFAAFTADFAGLEKALAQGVGHPIERLILDLNFTPKDVRTIERYFGTKLSWFAPAYAALRRHGLLKPHVDWGQWLKLYRKKQQLLSRKNVSKPAPQNNRRSTSINTK